jgi:hypothetical protein
MICRLGQTASLPACRNGRTQQQQQPAHLLLPLLRLLAASLTCCGKLGLVPVQRLGGTRVVVISPVFPRRRVL